MKKVKLYTDGSCLGNPGPGGWGALLISGDKEKEMSGAEKNTTNNKMELLAVIEGLKALKTECEVEIYTDSQYVKNGMMTWIHGWIKNGWKTAARKPVKNKELWQALHEQVQRHKIEWHWVKGHAGHPENERVDQLANNAAQSLK